MTVTHPAHHVAASTADRMRRRLADCYRWTEPMLVEMRDAPDSFAHLGRGREFARLALDAAEAAAQLDVALEILRSLDEVQR